MNIENFPPRPHTRGGRDAMIRLVVAGDQPIVREGFKRLIGLHTDLELVGEAVESRQAQEQVRKLRPDVLILDVDSSGARCLEVIGQLRNEETNILVLSLQSERLYAVRAFRNGAAGFMNKQHSADELVNAIRHIHTKGRYVAPEQAEMLALEVADDGTVPHRGLSDREYEVFRLLALGHTVSEIGKSLSSVRRPSAPTASGYFESSTRQPTRTCFSTPATTVRSDDG